MHRLFLFDVDGTLSMPRLAAEKSMLSFLQRIRQHPNVKVGFVGGSDLNKISEQLGDKCELNYDYAFAENGLIAIKDGIRIASNSVLHKFGESLLQQIISFALIYIGELILPVKRGTFVEFRTGMLNISPIGRNCSQDERIAFYEYDQKNKIRQRMIDALRERFAKENITYSIGGQISFDLFPTGWDKTYCLQFVRDDNFDEIHFFGDKTYKGGNDYEIFESNVTIGHTVTSPEDTMRQVQAILNE